MLSPMDEPSRLRRFLAPDECRIGELVTLAPEQSRHMVTVLRLGRGRSVRIFTGAGREFVGQVEDAHASAARVRILEELQLPPRTLGARTLSALTLAFAPAPGNRSDIVVEKATELGVDLLLPLLCERLQGGRAQAAAHRADRWRRKAADAARQSQRTVVPTVGAPVPFERFVQAANAGLRIIAAGPGHPALYSVLSGAQVPPGPVSLAVGPAGGFTQRELALAAGAGFLPVSLGPHVLRVETAAICLVAGVMLYLGREGG